MTALSPCDAAAVRRVVEVAQASAESSARAAADARRAADDACRAARQHAAALAVLLELLDLMIPLD